MRATSTLLLLCPCWAPARIAGFAAPSSLLRPSHCRPLRCPSASVDLERPRTMACSVVACSKPSLAVAAKSSAARRPARVQVVARAQKAEQKVRGEATPTPDPRTTHMEPRTCCAAPGDAADLQQQNAGGSRRRGQCLSASLPPPHRPPSLLRSSAAVCASGCRCGCPVRGCPGHRPRCPGCAGGHDGC